MTRKTITSRTQNRVHRLAYDFEDMAWRARADRLDRLANSLKNVAHMCAELVRDEELWK